MKILDDRLEPALDALRRAKLRRLTRAAWSHSSLRTRISKILGNLLGVPRGEIERALLRPSAGAVWAELEAKTSALIRKTVRVTDLERQTDQARSILPMLQSRSPDCRSQSEILLPSVHDL